MFNRKKLASELEKYKNMYSNKIMQLDGSYKSIAYLEKETSKLKEELVLWKEKYFNLLNKNIEIMESIRVARGDTK